VDQRQEPAGQAVATRVQCAAGNHLADRILHGWRHAEVERDATHKRGVYVITWHVGKRTQETAVAFEADTRARVVLMQQITTDGFNGYPVAIGAAFGVGVDYSQGVKHYRSGGRKDEDHRYEPARDPLLTKHAVFGAPDLDASTTAHVERLNGITRHIIGRMRRLVYAFSKSPVDDLGDPQVFNRRVVRLAGWGRRLFACTHGVAALGRVKGRLLRPLRGCALDPPEAGVHVGIGHGDAGGVETCAWAFG